ncbi:MAG: hypothetical protein D6714_00895 [Bacteroidetes bacterium]|nr:MAG: hypothetical protein D6714_00895 [Bacteroidota bacterium]
MYYLRLEWLKMKKLRTFQAIIFLFAIALPGLLLTTKSFNVNPEDMPPFLSSFDLLFRFPTVWEWLGYIGNWLAFFFLGFLAVIMVTNEYAYRTLRQNIINGLSRNEFFATKIGFMLVICLAATLYYTAWCLGFGFWHTDTVYQSTVVKNSDYILRFFLMSLGYMSFGFLLGMVVKRTGIALLLYLTYSVIIESILRGLHLYFFQNRSMNFFPMNVFEDLAPFPVLEKADGFTQENGFELLLPPAEAMLASVGYILLFTGLSYWVLKRSDL